METEVNIDDPATKVVGRRRMPQYPSEYGLGLQSSLRKLARIHVPRGVFRFRSFEEADQWMMEHIAGKRVN